MNVFRIAGQTALAVTAALALGGPVLAQTGAVNASTPQGMSTGPVSDQAAASAQGNAGEPSAPAPASMSSPGTSAATTTHHRSRHGKSSATPVGPNQTESASKTMGEDMNAGGPH